ncbi:MAG: hypothetical protein ACI8W8_005146, partial [Rhodothermales bacterium]
MKLHTNTNVLLEIQGRNAPRRCERGPQRVTVPVLQIQVQDWPQESNLAALLLMADLQYVNRSDLPIAHRQLMGESVAQKLAELAEVGLLPAAENTGVVLAGDMYTCRDLAGLRGCHHMRELTRVSHYSLRSSVKIGEIDASHYTKRLRSGRLSVARTLSR